MEINTEDLFLDGTAALFHKLQLMKELDELKNEMQEILDFLKEIPEELKDKNER